MKKLIKSLFYVAFAVPIVTGCDDDANITPPQPDFIVLSLSSDLAVYVGETFEMSVPEQGNTESYSWTLPEVLSVVGGENTNKLSVYATVEGVIPEAAIQVVALHDGKASAPRTLYKKITVNALPDLGENYIRTTLTGSMTVEQNQVISFSVAEEDPTYNYQWSVPEGMEIVSGQGTGIVSVKVTGTSFNVPANTISVTTTRGFNEPEVNYYDKFICVLPLANYTAKRFGNKTWMTQNVNDGGPNDDVGRLNTSVDADGTLFGRYYTWVEAMTGLPDGEAAEAYAYGSSGTDDVGNSYTLNNGEESYNIQIRGICPEGWHVPNAYDYYDLIVAIASEYNLMKSSIGEVASSNSGIYIDPSKRNAPLVAMPLTSHGFPGAYLRGSRSAAEGGLWSTTGSIDNQGVYFYYAGNSTFTYTTSYPLFFNADSEQIGFNSLPGGSWRGTAYSNVKEHAFMWLATATSAGTNYRFSNHCNNSNLAVSAEAAVVACNVRCVANYYD